MADDANPEKTRRDGPDRLAWRRFGPYLSERQWGSVREDRGTDPDSWAAFPHDHARSRAYLYGEDGIAGISDDYQNLCLALTLWNGKDPILKERYFGLANTEGNHGEDAKEYWFHLDATPTASYLKSLYKYPQGAFPYADIVDETKRRGRDVPEYELLDAGIFDEHRYFDVVTEYAKASPEELYMRVTATNRGPEPATLHLLPTAWFRNTWQEDAAHPVRGEPPVIRAVGGALHLAHPLLGELILESVSGVAPTLLFCDNETNPDRVPGWPRRSKYPKDGINDHVIDGAKTVNPALTGTKAALWSVHAIEPGESQVVTLRLRPASVDSPPDPEGVFAVRLADADAFHREISLAGAPSHVATERAMIMRQALSGMVWCQQYYEYPVAAWMKRRGARPFVDRSGRNSRWPHIRADHVISMPDSWEYPWFAAWDLAFHTIPLALVDPIFAKRQLELLMRSDYLHPDGQIPAYEWNFDDVNPPVHAWATLVVYQLDGHLNGTFDTSWLAKVFDRLLLNFTWWVNRKDPEGDNLFSGGFLGLDNIGVFDRSQPLPGGAVLQQADGTAWVASYAQAMLAIAAELAATEQERWTLVRKFAEHYLWIAAQVYGTEGGAALWDDEDGFFYDAVRFPDGHTEQLRVRSLVGLLPLAASMTVQTGDVKASRTPWTWLDKFVSDFAADLPLVENLPPANADGTHLLSLVDEYRLRKLLTAMLDEKEFLSPHGIRSMSKRHREQPYTLELDDQEHSVSYVPGDSNSPMFGGNSNWRGPVWFPMNVILLRGLLELHSYWGDDFTVDFPTGSGNKLNLSQVAAKLIDRQIALFEVGDNGRRPAHGDHPIWADEHWRDLIVFSEYFHGDTGAGLGASHQTGWTGLVASLIYLNAHDEIRAQFL